MATKIQAYCDAHGVHVRRVGDEAWTDEPLADRLDWAESESLWDAIADAWDAWATDAEDSAELRA